MSATVDIAEAFDALRAALGDWQLDLLELFRPPEPVSGDWVDAPGAEQLRALWAITGGQDPEREPALGAIGGLLLLGPNDSEAERAKWADITTEGEGLAAVAPGSWTSGKALQPEMVRNVYFARGWIPLFCEPMEANYLAVDLVPLAAGRPGQIILCGRDEDDKCVVAPDLATLFERLAAECRDGAWRVMTGTSRSGESFRYVKTGDGRLLTAIREWVESGRWPPG